jgi:hypothetical protein
LEEIFGGLKGGVRLCGTGGKVELETHPNLMEPLPGLKMLRRPTYHLPLKVWLAFLELNKGSSEAGIGSDQQRGITLIKVKGCLADCLVGDLGGFVRQETVKGCWCPAGEEVIG